MTLFCILVLILSNTIHRLSTFITRWIQCCKGLIVQNMNVQIAYTQHNVISCIYKHMHTHIINDTLPSCIRTETTQSVLPFLTVTSKSWNVSAQYDMKTDLQLPQCYKHLLEQFPGYIKHEMISHGVVIDHVLVESDN